MTGDSFLSINMPTPEMALSNGPHLKSLDTWCWSRFLNSSSWTRGISQTAPFSQCSALYRVSGCNFPLPWFAQAESGMMALVCHTPILRLSKNFLTHDGQRLDIDDADALQ